MLLHLIKWFKSSYSWTPIIKALDSLEDLEPFSATPFVTKCFIQIIENPLIIVSEHLWITRDDVTPVDNPHTKFFIKTLIVIFTNIDRLYITLNNMNYRTSHKNELIQDGITSISYCVNVPFKQYISILLPVITSFLYVSNNGMV